MHPLDPEPHRHQHQYQNQNRNQQRHLDQVLVLAMAMFALLCSCSEEVSGVPETPASAAEAVEPAADPAPVPVPEPEPEAPVDPAPAPAAEPAETEDAHEAKVRLPPPTQEVIDKLPPDGGPEFNRLVFEKSPYLLQHARNPVDWYPWGEEAFAAAKEQDKPIFLSIGYSTCHWCHVMEHESFEDAEVARVLNEKYIAIKVDREEREDVDSIYMAVCLAMNGSGGWPLSIFLTADRKAFFAGTYYPKADQGNRPGFISLLRSISDAWGEQRQNLLTQADRVLDFLEKNEETPPSTVLTELTLEKAFQAFSETFDEENGGFGRSPKFPSPHDYTFLLRYWDRTGDKRALDIVTKSLTAMRRGGMYDHVGFGFHRYSTDQKWFLPHFEKMLYDQATLLIAYTETHLATRDDFFAGVAREIATYVLRDMTSPEGGFYSAEDADSEGEEGKFYLWSVDEVLEILGEHEGRIIGQVFGCDNEGNFEEEASKKKTGTNIFHLTKSLEEEAAARSLDPEDLRQRWEKARQKLFAVREKRIHPLKDDKVITSWNGLMIAAMARAGRALDEPAYVEAAERAAGFVLNNLRDRNGRLLRRYRNGEAAFLGYLDDYAFLTWGLIELYEATFDLRHLENATALNSDMLRLFGDAKSGGLFFTGSDGEELVMRRKEVYDGAVPSGNSIAALNLQRLSRLLGKPELDERAADLMEALSGEVARVPSGYAQFLWAVDFSLGPSREIVIAGKRDDAATRRMLRATSGGYYPRQVVLLRPEGEDEVIRRLPAYAQAQKMVNDKATAYVCENFACQLPVNDTLALVAQLEAPPPGRAKKETEEKPEGGDKP